jgi:hypothetical protein
MNFLSIRAGEHIEVGAITGYRAWRYFWDDKPQLWSLVADCMWVPGELMDAPPDTGHRTGLHAFKSLKDLMAFNPLRTIRALQIYGDGVVLGKVSLWGVVWEHQRGYRAQHAKPIEFISSYAYCHSNAAKALTKLRENFQCTS